MGFIFLFIFPPSYVALWGCKARHRLVSESVSWCLETSLFFKTPFPGWISVPTSFVSLFIFYLFSYLLSKTTGCSSGCLMSSAGIQKLFCGIYSAFKWSFDEFVGDKVVSPSYSSAILGPPSNFLEEISNLSHSIVFLYFFSLITEEGFLIPLCYSLEFCIQMCIYFLFSFAFCFSSFLSYL